MSIQHDLENAFADAVKGIKVAIDGGDKDAAHAVLDKMRDTLRGAVERAFDPPGSGE